MRRLERPDHVRYLTFSCDDRLPLFRHDRIKQVLLEQMVLARQRHEFKLHAWVFMPEHVHLLLRADGATVPQILRTFKTGSAKRILTRWRELNAPVLHRLADARGGHRLWLAGGGYDRNLWSREEIEEKVLYIHRNPVERGLVTTPTEYEWSSARWWAGDREHGPPLDHIGM